MTWPQAITSCIGFLSAAFAFVGVWLVITDSIKIHWSNIPDREPSIEDDDDASFNIPVQRIHPQAVIPRKANPTDAAYDLWATEDVVLQPREYKLIPTGLKIAIPGGYYGRIAPRSGHAVKSGLDVLAGCIDPSYRGEIGVVLINHSDAPYAIPREKAIAQIIIEAHYDAVWNEVPALDETTRGDGGFGSTDPNLPFSKGGL